MILIKNFLKKYTQEIVFAILFNIVGMLIGYTMHNSLADWYPNLIKPSFNPPNWIFGPVWTILYAMLGVIFVRLWKIRAERGIQFNLFITQMLLNYTWTPLFFGLRRIDLGFYNLVLMWICTFALLLSLRKDKTTFLMLIPYFCWITFAGLINGYLFFYN